ncbi:MAG: SulP family inorganic anion transporter [Caldilineaceae bacterium]|nr:SulP family inorganic anion transporter [Caldilineaceae bacterium]
MLDRLRNNGLLVSGKVFVNNLISGLIMAVITVPGAVANGVLAGVNPVFGLYSMIVGTTVAAFVTSSMLMNVDSTSATSIATGDALIGISPDQQLSYLVVLGVLIGLVQLVFGLLRLGKVVRYISNSVMTGFLSGLGILTILGQISDLTGYYSQANNKVIRLVDTLLHVGEIDLPTLMVGIAALVTILVLERTSLSRYSYLIGLALVTIAVILWKPASVVLVGDTSPIPRSLPHFIMPDITLIPAMFSAAVAIAIIALVQAAGVSQSVPNPNGQYSNISRDFSGQGVANVAVGFVGGIPVGGSLSGTKLIQNVGGTSRWANIFTGIFGALTVLLFGKLIELLPMAGLAGLLIAVGVSMINVGRIRLVLNTGLVPMAIAAVTFLATLVLPIQYAVALGVALHILLYVYRSAERLQIERMIRNEDGSFSAAQAPKVLTSNEVVLLQPVGSLFFAGAAEFEENLPSIGDARRTVVIIRLRTQEDVGSTFISVLTRYVEKLRAQGNVLMLAGVDKHVYRQLERTDLLKLIDKQNVFLEEKRYRASLLKAYQRAQDYDWSGTERPLES